MANLRRSESHRYILRNTLSTAAFCDKKNVVSKRCFSTLTYKAKVNEKHCENYESKREALKYLRGRFPRSNEATIMEGIFIGPKSKKCEWRKHFRQ